MVFSALLALASAACYRAAGSGIGYKVPWCIGFGLSFAGACAALQEDANGVAYGLAALAGAVARGLPLGNAVGPVVAGERPSRYAGDKGPNDSGPEKWQVGFLTSSAFASIVALGMIRGALFVPAALTDGFWWSAVAGIAFATPVSTYGAKFILRDSTGDDRWAWHEMVLPLIAYAVVFGAVLS